MSTRSNERIVQTRMQIKEVIKLKDRDLGFLTKDGRFFIRCWTENKQEFEWIEIQLPKDEEVKS